jgi:hypothetical protein
MRMLEERDFGVRVDREDNGLELLSFLIVDESFLLEYERSLRSWIIWKLPVNVRVWMDNTMTCSNLQISDFP